MSDQVRCSFELRTPAIDHPGMFVYTRLWVDGFDGDGRIHTSHPPAVGDTVWLTDRDAASGTYRVINRDWSYPVYGSLNWPRGQRGPKHGPLLNCLVERAGGFIQDEAPYAEDDDEEEAP